VDEKAEIEVSSVEFTVISEANSDHVLPRKRYKTSHFFDAMSRLQVNKL
jgi:hypothetical protein